MKKLVRVGKEGWIALTADKELERAYLNTIVHNRVKLFIFNDNNSGAVHWLGSFINAYEDITARIARNEPPIVMRLSRHGSISTTRLKADSLSVRQPSCKQE